MKMDLVCRLILLFGASSLLPSLPTKGTEENPSLPRQNRLVDKTPKPGNVFNKVVVVASSSSRERNLGDHFLLRVSLQKSLKAARCVFFPQKGKTPPPSRDDDDDERCQSPPPWWCRLAAMEENTDDDLLVANIKGQ